jgi:hypothetical protein
MRETLPAPGEKNMRTVVTAMLIAATCFTVGILFLCLTLIGIALLTEPEEWKPGGGANIGAGLLYMALLLNLPVLVAWVIWWFASSGKRAS